MFFIDKIKKLLLEPENINELKLADDTISYWQYTAWRKRRNSFFMEMINAIKNKNDKLVNKILKRLNNIENKAKLIYDFYIGFISNPNEVIQLIAQKTDFDTDGELSFLKFQLYLNKVSELTNSLTPNNLEIILNKQNDFINFVTYFNILCTEKMHKEPQVSINFVRKLKITNKKHN